MTAGAPDQQIVLGGVRAGGLLCSEVQRQDLAARESGRSMLIISAGSEAVFIDDVASAYSLKAAQYRAAESGLPTIRANVLGPSGIVDRYGTLAAYYPRGRSGSWESVMVLEEPRPTLFSRWGNLPLYVALASIAATAFWLRRKSAVH